MRKGEITCYKQFLLFSQCFPQLYIISVSKCGIVWKWVKNLDRWSVFCRTLYELLTKGQMEFYQKKTLVCNCNKQSLISALQLQMDLDFVDFTLIILETFLCQYKLITHIFSELLQFRIAW